MSVAARVFFVQIVDGASLQSKAVDQWTRELPVTAARGYIYDRNGKVLAGNLTSYAVYVRSRSVKDPAGVAKRLSEVLGVDADALYTKIVSDASSEITVKRRVEKSVTDRLMKYDLDGVYFSTDNTRVYPFGDSLCQILG
ncbi:MAG: hypothetical protein IJS67_04070 [Clostridia bacterium]|nr:hypothetical protein [Clostridia bacterium]